MHMNEKLLAGLLLMAICVLPARAEDMPNWPNGYAVSGYLDCGAAERAEGEGGVCLRQVQGQACSFPGVEGGMGTAAVDAEVVRCEVSGLDAREEYVIGMAWWDADNLGRVQSIYLGGSPESLTRVLPPTPAKAFYEDKPTWATALLPLRPEMRTQGAVTLEIRREAGPNAVLNGLWILKKSDKALEKRLLIVTGDDYPGHRWRETGPELAEILREDPRLEVSISEVPAILGSPLLMHYDAVLIHFKNYSERLPLGREVWDGFRAFVDQGRGVVVAHFGCGAFQEWEEFVQVAGRIWNPKFRAHDPYGPFDVRIMDHEHPITQKMQDFSTTDELYTCLDGTPPIHILCEATSKVDQKSYPMGFVLESASLRVFHCPLGHDQNALQSEGARELYRCAARWAVQLSAR